MRPELIFGVLLFATVVSLAYALSAAGPAEQPKPPAIVAAERLEYRERDAARAIDAYRTLSVSPDPKLRAAGLAGLARVLRNAGRRDEARAAYATLEAQGRTTVGALPAALIALEARCEMAEEDRAAADLARLSAEFYGALVEGRWLLERERYTFYVGRAANWYSASGARPDAIDSLRQREAEKVALTIAADRWLTTVRDTMAPGAARWLAPATRGPCTRSFRRWCLPIFSARPRPRSRCSGRARVAIFLRQPATWGRSTGSDGLSRSAARWRATCWRCQTPTPSCQGPARPG